MKILHLLLDHNFVKGPRQRFEQYYPGQNIFVIHSTKPADTLSKYPDGFIVLDMNLPENQAKVVEICRREGVDKLLLHGLNRYQPTLVRDIKAQNSKLTVYWMFWGYDLYETLSYEKGYRLMDDRFNPLRRDCLVKPYPILRNVKRLMNRYRPDAYKQLMAMADYFCFWNKGDYDLLKANFNLPIRYKFFAYSANMPGDKPQYMFDLKERTTTRIMVNHQASLYGNHSTIFRRLNEIDPDNTLEKVVPLSYGIPAVRQRTIMEGSRYFAEKFLPILDYMPREQYFDMLQSIDVAIFGQRRQEASGNIIHMLKNGVKVFLRNDNNLLKYYRDKGYLIYSFEDDLKDMDSLKALSLEQQKHNRECYLANLIYYDNFMPQLFEE
ncbi:MAG: hypothetical protein K2I91_00875 [Muribaculaceae bacterium]|nr:hypothetical protein [Muribaculaceae bacterium]